MKCLVRLAGALCYDFFYFFRQELSDLLGFKNFAFLSLDMKMAKEPKAVMDMIETLKNKSKDKAHQEFDELQVN